MRDDWDMIVIGSGAGGGTFAYACARAGKRVLVLERGGTWSPRGTAHDEQAMLIEKTPYETRPVWVNDAPRRLYAGGIVGGGTSLYGAALVRPSQDDFHPGRHYGRRIARAIWDWPISYETLEPFYTEAESLYRVCGPRDDEFGPLGRPEQGYPHPPIPVKPINQRIIAASRARGLKPFRLPLAVDFRRCLQCDVCPGYVCPNGARQSAANLLDRAASDGLALEVRTGIEAERFEWNGRGNVAGVRVRDLARGTEQTLKARGYALAAGALGSPVVLLQSGHPHPLIGRNYMMHLSPIAFGVFPRATGADATFVKQLGFADFYHGTPSCPHKLGLVQSLPVPGPRTLAKATSRYLPAGLLRFLRAHAVFLAGIVEDLPDANNRVSSRPDGGIELCHQFARYDLERGRTLGALMRQILRNAGAVFAGFRYWLSAEHVGHQCGTLRFGTDSAHAAVDPDCRVFGTSNLFVVDGSVFPTSLGVGPALTIMANALRVARIATRAL
jgi:choline dehydrogenase-like flavoprotein